MEKILNPAYSLKLKNIILFLNRGLVFFSNGHIRNVVSTLPNDVKVDVENDNVVSMLSNFNVEIQNVVSILLNVLNYNIDVHNVVSTVILRCATSRRQINLKTTLNRRWNICWVGYNDDDIARRAVRTHFPGKYRMRLGDAKNVLRGGDQYWPPSPRQGFIERSRPLVLFIKMQERWGLTIHGVGRGISFAIRGLKIIANHWRKRCNNCPYSRWFKRSW